MTVLKRLALFTAGLTAVFNASAAVISVVNFETVPVLAQGPSTFGSPAQNVVVPNVATFSGGTVLGLATNFPAIIYATAPNVYGTTNGAGYLETLTIAVNPSNIVNEVSLPIFNGETFAQSYVATAFNGVTQVAQQTFLNVPANTGSGYALVDLLSPNITSVTITPSGAPAAFDFLIDTVAFNESVQQAVSPEPASFFLAAIAIGIVVFLQRGRLRA